MNNNPLLFSIKDLKKLAIVLAVSGALALAIGGTSGCTDPVRDAEIEALGPEAPGETPGPEHRAGQPCLHCHSKGGPAEAHPFALAGTIFETPAFDSKPAANITVQFVDANGNAQRSEPPVTNDVGNFWLPLEDWPDMAFPIRVGLYNDPGKPPIQVMNSLIGREGSCNFCHRPNINPEDIKQAGDEEKARMLLDSTESAGQIYSGAQPAK
jgi:hypothetical protein